VPPRILGNPRPAALSRRTALADALRWLLVPVCLLAAACRHTSTTAVAARPPAATRLDGAQPEAPVRVAMADPAPSRPTHSPGTKLAPARTSLSKSAKVVPRAEDAEADHEGTVTLAAAEEAIADPPSPAGAFTPLGLTLGQLDQMALSYNPSIGQASAAVHKALGVRTQVGLHANPTIGYMGDEMGDDGTAGDQGAYVSQTIVTGDKLGWNRRVVDQEIQVLLWQAEAQRQRVRTDVRMQFYETLGAQRRVELSLELERIAQAGVETAQRLVDALQAGRPDLLQAEIQLNEVSIVRQNAEYAYNAAWQRLAALVGLSQLVPSPLAGNLEDHGPDRDWHSALNQVLAGSPQVQQAAAAVQRASTLIERERRQPIPNVMLQAQVMHMNVSDDEAASLMVGLPVPLFNRNQGNIDRAHAEYVWACREYERLKLSLQSRLAEAYRDHQQSHNAVRRYREEILPRAQENLDLTETAYENLQFDFLRILTARRSYFETNLRYVDALVALQKADALLDGLLLTGGLDMAPDSPIDARLRDDALMGQ
jgi:cobalt-zinc-cadmium efflux system outer membrane protein